MDDHRQVLQSTLAPQDLQHKLNIFSDVRRPLVKEWQIHSELWSRIYRFVDCAAEALGLDISWAFRAGQGHAQPCGVTGRTTCCLMLWQAHELQEGSQSDVLKWESRSMVCMLAPCCTLIMAVVAAAGSTRNKSQADLQAWMVEAGIEHSIKVVHAGKGHCHIHCTIHLLGVWIIQELCKVCLPSQLMM